jgi:hypothetical protein
MNEKGFGRKRAWPNGRNVPADTMKHPCRIAGIPAEIRTEHLSRFF